MLPTSSVMRIIKAHITHMDYYYTFNIFYILRGSIKCPQRKCLEREMALSPQWTLSNTSWGKAGPRWYIVTPHRTLDHCTVSSAVRMDFFLFLFLRADHFLQHKAWWTYGPVKVISTLDFTTGYRLVYLRLHTDFRSFVEGDAKLHRKWISFFSIWSKFSPYYTLIVVLLLKASVWICVNDI